MGSGFKLFWSGAFVNRGARVLDAPYESIWHLTVDLKP